MGLGVRLVVLVTAADVRIDKTKLVTPTRATTRAAGAG
jgi:hypothetical protein